MVFKGELSFSRCVVSAGDTWVDGETGCREFRVRGSDCAPLAVKEDNKGIARKVHRRTPNLDHFSTGTAFSKVTIYCLSN